MKAYLSLPITGHDLQSRKNLASRICALLHIQYPDWHIVNPFDIASLVHKDKMLRTHTLDLPTYEEYMQADLAELATCDRCLFAQGWETSEGCKREMAFCKDNHIEVEFLKTTLQ